MKETGDSKYIYQNDLDKGCFQRDKTYGDFKDSPKRTASDKVLCDKTLHIVKHSNYDGYQKGLASLVHTFFHKVPLRLEINLPLQVLKLLILLLVLLKVKLCLMNN